MTRSKNPNKRNVFNIIIKVVSSLLIVGGLVLASYSIYQFISNILLLREHYDTGLNEIVDQASALVWATNFDTSINTVDNSFYMIILSTIIIFSIAIITKLLLSINKGFILIRQKDPYFKKQARKSFISSFIFSVLVVAALIIAFYAIYKILNDLHLIITNSNLVVDDGILTLEALDPNITLQELEETINLITSGIEVNLSQLNIDTLINDTWPLITLFGAALGAWIIILIIQSIVSRILRIK